MRRKNRNLTRGGIAVAVAAAAAVALPVAPAFAAAGTAAKAHPLGAVKPTVKVAARVKLRAQDALPVSVDLRSNAPVVGDQGQVGSCVAWSIGYSLSGYYAKALATSSAPYAPLYLYMRTVQGTPGPNTGLSVTAALRNEQNEGIDTQADYFQGTTDYSQAVTAAEVANAANYKLTGWTTLFSGLQSGTTAQQVIEQSLAAGTPVSITIPVYNAFYSVHSMDPYSSTAGTLLGYHEITAYGYDSTGLIIRNSWGSSWGSAGDAKLAWSFVNSKVQGAYTVTGMSDSGQAVVAKPSVTKLSVAKAVPGTTITITGTGLSDATSVKFGALPAEFTNVTTSSGATALAAVVPAGTVGSAVDVTVTNSAGTSATSSADKFTYLAGAPTVSVLTPASVSTVGGAAITLTGTNLTGASVKVGTAAVVVRNVSATSLTFTAPAHAAESVKLTVTTSGGTVTTPLTYVLPDAPTVTSLSATSVSTRTATPITVTGTSFVGTVSATVDGKVAGVTRISDTQVRLTAPAHVAGTVPVVIKAAGGSATAVSLTYVAPAPAVGSVSPSTGSVTKGATVTVAGTSFTGATSVTVGGTPVRFTVNSDSSLKVTVPAMATGTYVVTVTTAAGTSTSTTVKYTARA
jgi:hypothetical protein